MSAPGVTRPRVSSGRPEAMTADSLREIVMAAAFEPRAERHRLERAVNWARWAGALLVFGAGPFFPNTGIAEVLALGCFMLLYGVAFRWLSGRLPDGHASTSLVWATFLADIGVVVWAMYVFMPDAHWTTFVYGGLVVIIGAFRFGGSGAAIAAVGMGAGHATLAVFRSVTLGFDLEPERVIANVSFYALTAVLMVAILRELHALRARQSGFYEPLLAAQSDLGELIIIADGARPVYLNDAVARVTGMSPEQLSSLTSVSGIVAPDERDRHLARIRACASGGHGSTFETEFLAMNGSRVPVEVALEPFRTGDRTWTLAIARDISERREAQRALAHQAIHDPLTGLANRTLLADRLDRAVAAGRRSAKPVSLLILDLDRFKEVNDTFGHQVGDLLLGQLACRIESLLREADTVARLGGDEFAFVLPETDEVGAHRVASSILTALHRPFVVAGNSLEVGGSVGISVFPTLAEDPASLMRQADVAMYVAKRADLGQAVYDASTDQAAGHELALVARLREAIQRDDLVVHYQPLTRFTGETMAVEALVRWPHPERGLLPPSAFIGLAERSGLIRPLFRSVLRTALRDRARWRASQPFAVSINLSARDLSDPTLAETVAGSLASASFAPSDLVLEITESQIIADPQAATSILDSLRAMGVRISLDDFGTGYSSLAYLHRLRVDQVKIDRSFTSCMRTDANSAAIVRAVIDLGHNFGLEVVAEGIEDQHTWSALAELGCDVGQGYFMGRPMSADATTAWLHESAPRQTQRVAWAPGYLGACAG